MGDIVTGAEKTASHDEKVSDPTLNHIENSPAAVNEIKNPLQNFTPEQTTQNARAFAEANGMREHADLFARGALVARDPTRFEKMPQLSVDEISALKYELEHKWHGPFVLWYSIALCAIGAATQGWDQTGSNGANLRANYGASTVMIAQQMCGINIISFYSSSIFEQVGYTPTQALYASLGYGAVQVVSTIPTLFLIDTKGRRTLTLSKIAKPPSIIERERLDANEA
ncbi:sugar transporter [Grosmannia clavigera kw1407]|uniref:Sugar transporter n=1 Tax=Grosmannia clavigera (strain kw1407 / UAMH 11150) TaxID=655863 RepID=F0XFX1_GROCL|nr:sugar transporter [Grosmannia clavigera kw1407]EFX03420.1 sugar transporter [Grosmannia clavigera kw1407]